MLRSVELTNRIFWINDLPSYSRIGVSKKKLQMSQKISRAHACEHERVHCVCVCVCVCIGDFLHAAATNNRQRVTL